MIMTSFSTCGVTEDVIMKLIVTIQYVVLSTYGCDWISGLRVLGHIFPLSIFAHLINSFRGIQYLMFKLCNARTSSHTYHA